MSSLLTILVAAQAVPPSPFKPKCFDPVRNIPVSSGGFPSSNAVIFPFRDIYQQPTIAQPSLKSCRADGHCMIGYELDVHEKN